MLATSTLPYNKTASIVHATNSISLPAFENIFKQYYSALCMHAYNYIADAALAEDIVSDVFSRIWEKREQISIDTSIKSYLYRCVGNQCIDTLRKQYHKKIVHVDAYSDTLQNNVEIEQFNSIEVKQLHAAIQEAINSLPKQCGIIFRLSRDIGLKYQEIANELNISIKTVETQMGRAFKQLRAALLIQKQATKNIA